MTVEATAGSRIALWWVQALTHTAEREVAGERRAEIASDVHEQLVEAEQRGALAAGSRSVISRVVRGIPVDLLWRLRLEAQPGRLAWHLRNPSTAITSLLVLMFPLNAAADSTLPGGRDAFLGYGVALWIATDLVAGCILLFAAAVLADRIWPRWTGGVDRHQPRSPRERVRRCLTAMTGVALAGSATLRFGVFEPLGGVFWLAFVGCVFLYLALLAAFGVRRVLTLGR